MTTKADFNGDEWERVAEGPALAGLIVATSQRGGTLRESVAMGKAYAEAAEEHREGTDLLSDVVATVPRLDTRHFKSAEDLQTRGLQLLSEAAALVDERATPEEADAYKRFAVAVAKRAAEADKSGGFFGIGGERVTDAEQSALAHVAAALGAEPPVQSEG